MLYNCKISYYYKHYSYNQINLWYIYLLLQTQVLGVGQADEPCIGLIQENLIENSVQDSLLYILKPHGPC